MQDAPAPRWRAFAPPVDTGHAHVSRADAASAYAQSRHEPTPPDRAALLRNIARAHGSATRLRSLRRQIAWILHPDRTPDACHEALLAELNAKIDEALMIAS